MHGTVNIDYQSMARLWAKALAFVACGKPEKASGYLQELVDILRIKGCVID